ncbi:MAG: hypothetical protein H6735_10365 [Alphaproteobacteria bacterium]|nr:hypothetical protein [Alphaproteobacteria bacterium]
MLWSFLLPIAFADDMTVDLAPAMAPAKKPVWEPKGKALEAYGRGDTKAKTEAWAEAMPLLTESLTIQPGCGKCLYGLGRALVGMAHTDEAIQVGNRITELYPDRKDGEWITFLANMEAHRPEATVAAADAYLAKDKAKLTAWYERNHDLAMLGKYDEAMARLEGAAAAGLKDADAACMKTEILTQKGELADARIAWGACDNADAWLQMRRTVEGRLLLAEDDWAGAQGKFSQGGAELESRLTLAFVRLKEEKFDQALNLAHKLGEDAPWALDAALAEAKALVGLGRTDDAVSLIQLKILHDQWEASHPVCDKTVLASRGEKWPDAVRAKAAAILIDADIAKGDVEAAQALHDKAVKALGAHDVLEKAMAAAQPAEPAPEPKKK